MKKLYLNIVSPEKEIYNGEVESVTCLLYTSDAADE